MRRLGIIGAVALLTLAAPVALGEGAAGWAQLVHNCDYCHNLHGGSSVQLRDWAVIEELCLSCHGDGGPAEWEGKTIPKGVSVHDGTKHSTPTGCWECHNHEAEADTNLYLVPSLLATPNSGDKAVVFTDSSGASSYADGDGTYNGICEVCHTNTTQHNNTGTVGKHNAAADCTTCHKHDGGFQGGGGCTGCHDTTQGPRRVIVAEFARASHHVDWTVAADSIPDSDCLTCHDLSKHQQGNVRLWDVDTPGDTTAAIVLAGDPGSSSTEAAKLTAFCLACHDADGASGDTVPFSDGITRPLIDVTAWSSSSHNGASAIAGCFGDGTYGCHGSGHGSEKRKILAPAGVAPDTTKFEEEEGFCYVCHTSGGAASTDIEGQFSTTTLWVAGAVGGNSNMNLNDRHDVDHTDQSTSGAKIECTDCHDPHSATAAQPWKTDPDPSDGRTPGTGEVFSGASFLSEFCMDCHDGSFPAAVTAPTTALNDVRTTWATDAMGAGGGNATLRSGYGWAANDTIACAACHSAHISSNLYHSVEVVYSKDGSTPVPSDGGSGYTLTDNSVKNTAVNGYNWCNTCHTGSMGDKKDNCYACHYHGTRW